MKTPCPPRRCASLMLVLALLPLTAAASTPQQLIADYAAQSGQTPDPARGREFFTASHGHEWRCATCHGALPIQEGHHQVTGKAIGAMAPALNPERFTASTKVEKWFRRNCNDVVGRECSAAEKADVLSWLVSLKP